jgi:kinesin family member 15
VKKLTRERILQLRINHHVKTKVLIVFFCLFLLFVNSVVFLSPSLVMHFPTLQQEENGLLKRQNEELTAKLQQLGAILARSKEELAHHRVSDGRDPYEQIVNYKFKSQQGQ